VGKIPPEEVMPMEAVIVIQGNKRVVRMDVPEHFVKMYIKNEAAPIIEMPLHVFLAFWNLLEPVAREVAAVTPLEDFSKSPQRPCNLDLDSCPGGKECPHYNLGSEKEE
jgi:hypothetical protein